MRREWYTRRVDQAGVGRLRVSRRVSVSVPVLLREAGCGGHLRENPGISAGIPECLTTLDHRSQLWHLFDCQYSAPNVFETAPSDPLCQHSSNDKCLLECDAQVG